jgi:hypothetical protein
MKLLIPLTILTISYIIYYFFYIPPKEKEGDFIEVEKVGKYKNPYTKQNPYSPYEKKGEWQKQIPSIRQSDPEEKVIQKEYLSLDDIKHKMPKKEVLPMSRTFNYEVFLQVKKILQQSSSTYYSKKHIVLNSNIISILNTQTSRDKFKSYLATDFGLDDETIDEQMRENRTVWDWVVFLAP